MGGHPENLPVAHIRLLTKLFGVCAHLAIVKGTPVDGRNAAEQSSSGLTIVFSKLVIMTGNRGRLLRMVFENCNPLIYSAAMITI